MTETERERLLHAIFDAWQWLQDENSDSAAKSLLAGVLAHAEYPPYIKARAS